MTDETPRIIEPEAIAAARGRLEACAAMDDCPDDRSLTALDGDPASFADLRLLLSSTTRDRRTGKAQRRPSPA